MPEFGITARMWTDAKRQPLYEAGDSSRNFAWRTLEYTKPLRSFPTASAGSSRPRISGYYGCYDSKRMPISGEPEPIMDDLRFFAGLAAITIFVIGLLVYSGQKISRAAERNAAHIDLPLYVTRTGTVFFVCTAAFWVYCVGARVLAPQSSFGEYLGTFDGAASVVLGSCIFVGIAWVISGKLGYPFAKWERDQGLE